MRRHLPNILTVSNLFCGVLTILSVLRGWWQLAVILAITSLLADFLDGLVARRLDVASPIGKELDSLADLISFGLVPGLVLAWMGGLSKVFTGEMSFWEIALANQVAIGVGLLIPAFSAVRLAKFNLDVRQTDQFIGIPTPANTILVISLWLIAEKFPEHWLSVMLAQPWLLVGLGALLCFLLVAELPLLALKFQDFSWRNNRSRYLLIGGAVLLLMGLQFFAPPAIFLLYLGLSVIALRKGGQSNPA
jgi:CDP-diacylglycerol---serine O-phosphatidyltransferase